MKAPLISPSFNPITWQCLYARLWKYSFHSLFAHAVTDLLFRSLLVRQHYKLHWLPTTCGVPSVCEEQIQGIIKCYRSKNDFSTLTNLFLTYARLVLSNDEEVLQ